MNGTKVTIEIECTNAAFEPEPTAELARILRALAARVENQETGDGDSIFDLNGNNVGRIRVERWGKAS